MAESTAQGASADRDRIDASAGRNSRHKLRIGWCRRSGGPERPRRCAIAARRRESFRSAGAPTGGTSGKVCAGLRGDDFGAVAAPFARAGRISGLAARTDRPVDEGPCIAIGRAVRSMAASGSGAGGQVLRMAILSADRVDPGHFPGNPGLGDHHFANWNACPVGLLCKPEQSQATSEED